MLTITITKDGKAQEFTLPAALENAITRIVTESGSPFVSEAAYLIAALRDDLAPDVLRRYPPVDAATAAAKAADLRAQVAALDVAADAAIKAVSDDPLLAT